MQGIMFTLARLKISCHQQLVLYLIPEHVDALRGGGGGGKKKSLQYRIYFTQC